MPDLQSNIRGVMPFSLDMSQDWRVWDNVEFARFDSIRGPSSMPTDLPAAMARNLTTKELLASNGAYTGTDLVWLIPAATVATDFSAKPGDVITDRNGVAWTVLEVGLNKQRQTWRLVCRSLAIVYDLRDQITIEQSSIFQDAALAPVRSWKPVYKNLSARVHPDESAIVDERGLRGQQNRYIVVVDRQLPAFDVREHRILWDGKYLDIDKLTMAERISELPRMEARLKV